MNNNRSIKGITFLKEGYDAYFANFFETKCFSISQFTRQKNDINVCPVIEPEPGTAVLARTCDNIPTDQEFAQSESQQPTRGSCTSIPQPGTNNITGEPIKNVVDSLSAKTFSTGDAFAAPLNVLAPSQENLIQPTKIDNETPEMKIKKIFTNNKDDIDERGWLLKHTNEIIFGAVRRTCSLDEKDPAPYLNALKKSEGKILSYQQVDQLQKAAESESFDRDYDTLFKGLICLFKTLISIDLVDVNENRVYKYRSNEQAIDERDFHKKVLSAIEFYLIPMDFDVYFDLLSRPKDYWGRPVLPDFDKHFISIIHMGFRVRSCSRYCNEEQLMDSCLGRLEKIINKNKIPFF